MIVFPAIDLIEGQVVRLKRGNRAEMDVYATDPVQVAESFRAAGATWIHVVDLSAAFGESDTARAANAAALQALCGLSGLKIDAGGGIRSMGDIDRLLSCGVSRVAIGTALVRNPSFAEEAAHTFGDALVADIAGKQGEVRIAGWRERSSYTVDELVSHLVDRGFRHLVYTDISRDGMQTGIDSAIYRHIAECAHFPVVASGGIACLEDLRALAALGDKTIEGAICGRALYEQAFTLEEALAAVA
jgi:phosphoribosylformimino-5-aminoimidazole carboxamide ribotide isomerase